MKQVATLALMALLFLGCGRDQAPAASTTTGVAPADVPLQTDPYRLSGDVVPLTQQVSLNIDPAQADYSGSTTIRIRVATEVPEIRLHAQEMEITALALFRGDSAIPVAQASGEHGLLTITAAAPFAAGEYELQIAFTNDFNVDGVGISRTEVDGENYIFSQFQAIDARRAFPCFDEPGFKMPWQLTLTVPSDMTPITNTPEVAVTEDGARKTIEFDTTPPLPAYLIAVAVGPYEFVPIDGMSIPGRVAVPRGKSHLAAYAVETTPPLLAYLEDYFGEPYPFQKLDLIAVNLAFSGAMEHPGAVTYSDFFLLLDDSASVAQRATLIRITAHELAHQWFGNLVTMQWWNDLWLNESFADWMGDKASQAVYPDITTGYSELRTRFQVMNGDAEATTQPIRRDFKSTDAFDDGIFLAYYKGKAVLGMFEQAVGPEVFRAGVNRYLQKYSRGNAQAADLWHEINAGAEFDLASGIASFIDQPGVPLITVTDLGDGQFEFSQSRLMAGGAEVAQQWTIPLRFRYKVGATVHSGDLILDQVRQRVDLGEGVSWLLPNADQMGYLRWRIPGPMLAALGADATSDLNIPERMGLPNNLWALLAADQLDGDAYLAALRSLAADPDPNVQRAVVSELPELMDTFVTPALQADFGSYLQDVLRPMLDEIGSHPVTGESTAVTELRPLVLFYLAVNGGDAAAQATLSEYTEQYLAGETSMSALVNRALRTTARSGDTALLESLQQRLAASSSPTERRSLVIALSAFRDPALVEQVLDYALEGGELRAGEINRVLSGLLLAEENNEQLLDWAMRNDARLRELLSEGNMVTLPGRLMTCGADTVDQVVEFYGAEARFVPGIEAELTTEAADMRACAAFRAREIESIQAYLEAG